MSLVGDYGSDDEEEQAEQDLEDKKTKKKKKKVIVIFSGVICILMYDISRPLLCICGLHARMTDRFAWNMSIMLNPTNLGQAC